MHEIRRFRSVGSQNIKLESDRPDACEWDFDENLDPTSSSNQHFGDYLNIALS